ncbi:MAG: hypothetical protein ACLSHC_16445 [Bilophila wadsworthia]
MDYFDKAETWDRATLETVQLARLKTTFSKPRLSAPSARSRRSADNLRSHRGHPADSLCQQDDLRSQYQPSSPRFRIRIRAYALPSGTTGTPVAVAIPSPTSTAGPISLARWRMAAYATTCKTSGYA